MNAKKDHPNFKISNATLEITKKNSSYLDTSKISGADGIWCKSLKEMELWHRGIVVNAIAQLHSTKSELCVEVLCLFKSY